MGKTRWLIPNVTHLWKPSTSADFPFGKVPSSKHPDLKSMNLPRQVAPNTSTVNNGARGGSGGWDLIPDHLLRLSAAQGLKPRSSSIRPQTNRSFIPLKGLHFLHDGF